MTSYRAHPLDPLYEGRETARGDLECPGVGLDAFLPALAALLRETVARFEDTADRVSDLVIRQREQASLELVVALQDFDRLQQEFSALGDALFRYLDAAGSAAVPSQCCPVEHGVISGITLDDVKQRLLRRLGPAPEADAVVDEREF